MLAEPSTPPSPTDITLKLCVDPVCECLHMCQLSFVSADVTATVSAALAITVNVFQSTYAHITVALVF